MSDDRIGKIQQLTNEVLDLATVYIPPNVVGLNKGSINLRTIEVVEAELKSTQEKLRIATEALEEIERGTGRIGHRGVGEWSRVEMIECASEALAKIKGSV